MNYDILEKITDFSDFINQLKIRRDELWAECSQIDSEITDIEHAAEFFNLNASKGYKIYKMLHDATIRRRKCKDEIQRIDIILGNINADSINKINKKLKSIENKTYHPRVLKELFDSQKAVF